MLTHLPQPNGWGHLIISMALLGCSLVLIASEEVPAATGLITAVAAGWGFSVIATKRRQ